MRRVLTVFAVAAIMVTGAAPVAARSPAAGFTVIPLTASSFIQGSKTDSGRLAQSDAGLLARNDRALVNIMVKMDVDAIASYAGGVEGLKATSPGVTGKTLKDNSGAVGAYERYLSLKAVSIRRAVQRAVPAAQLGRTFLVAFGGFSARLPANKARDLLNVEGVSAVQYDAVNHVTANDSPIFVGATAVWPSLGGSNKAGEGVKVGVLDTGIWPEHPMLADPGISHPGGSYTCDFGDSGDTGDDAFTCNDKLIGAYAFLETNILVNGADTDENCIVADNDSPTTDTCSARDADGHGTHTSTTAAGSPVASSVLLGVDRGAISGIAPGAHVIMYRVCDENGCYGSDSVDAVEQAIIDDVDVINFSISGGTSPYSDSVELAFLDAYAAGILVNASAGNDGPGAATANHAGPWVNTVAASTLDRAFQSTLHLVADNLDTLDIDGVTVTAGISSATPVKMASDAPYSDAICNSVADPGDFTGVIAICKRGTNARVDKGYNVLQGGAEGMILYNQSAGVTDQESDNHWLPAIHTQYESDAIALFMAGHTGVTATWDPGTATAAQGDVMASFSSRGPLGDFIKPDVTAPGVQILAGMTPIHVGISTGPQGEYYQAIAGTSMSSPHAAGVAALLKDAHPSWTPGQIKSAMMTSSVQAGVVKEDGITPSDPFDRGAGSIRADRAIDPTVTFNVTAPQYYASAGDPFGRIDLNLPSINAPSMPGTITTTRTIRNATGVAQTINFSSTAPAGSSITITPNQVSLTAWGSATFSVKIDGQYLADGQYFGQIKLDPVAAGYRNAVVPVAFYKQPGEVTLENSCGATTLVAQELTIDKGDTANCEVTVTNYANTDANVEVRVKAPNTGRLIIKNWSDGNKKGNGFIWNGELSPALPPEILALTSPGYGYVSSPAIFGAVPEGGYGDETIGVYEGLPVPFWYGGEAYDAFGVDSNGYLVVGGGLGSEDNNCCDPVMPDPTRPNNVLAPYWTDLDPGSGGDIYVSLLFCGGTCYYYLIEWHQVPVFGAPAEERTFQIWLGAGGAGEDTSFEYCIDPNDATPSDGCDDAAPGLLGAGAPDGLVVGAENRDGSDAATIGPEDTEPSNLGYKVIAGSPTAGGTMTITYDAFGKKVGTFMVRALMTSDVTQGTAIQTVKIKVELD